MNFRFHYSNLSTILTQDTSFHNRLLFFIRLTA